MDAGCGGHGAVCCPTSLPLPLLRAAFPSRPYFVIPAKAGIQTRYPCEKVVTLAVMDSRLRGNDGRGGPLSVIPANAGSMDSAPFAVRIAARLSLDAPDPHQDTEEGHGRRVPPYSAGWSP